MITSPGATVSSHSHGPMHARGQNRGNAVASVTTILDATKDKTHLIEWRKRVGEATAKRITKEASGMGTRMHNCNQSAVSRRTSCVGFRFRDRATNARVHRG